MWCVWSGSCRGVNGGFCLFVACLVIMAAEKEQQTTQGGGGYEKKKKKKWCVTLKA